MKNEEIQNEESKLCDSVIVIDDDNDVRRLICDHLTQSGIKTVREYGSGKEGWEDLKTNNYDAIIIDWKLPEVSGAALINRCRKHPLHEFKPIIIISGFLNKKDFSLLEDLPFTALIEKPFQGAFLSRKLKDLIKEIQWFNSEKPRITELSESLLQGSQLQVEAFIDFLKAAPKPIPFAVSAARKLISQKNFAEAEKILNVILEKNSNCVLALTELGKILLQTTRQKDAETILKRAFDLAPDNIERLCMLGDSSLQKFDIEAANHYFGRAAKIDSENETAKAGLTLTDNVANYLSRTDITSIPASFASLLNAIGVSIVNSQQFQSGIEHYKSAMQFVSESEKLAKLAYNLGLGFLKWQKPTQAFEWFEKSVKFSNGRFHKAVRNVMKLKEFFQQKGMDIPTPEDSEAPIDEINFTVIEGGANAGKEYDFAPAEGGSLPAESSEKLSEGAEFENFGSLDKPKASEEETNAQDPIESFKKLVPFADAYFQKLKKEGEHVETTVDKLLPLFEEFDPAVILKAMDEGMKSDCSGAKHIMFKVNQLALKKAS